MSCNLCNGQEIEPKKIDTMQLYKGNLEIQDKSYKINNCPLCGDKLVELDITKAVIKENKACCPVCGEHNYRVLSKSYRSVLTSKGKATEIKAECVKCENRFTYMLQSRIKEDIRFIEDESKITEIIDEDNLDS